MCSFVLSSCPHAFSVFLTHTRIPTIDYTLCYSQHIVHTLADKHACIRVGSCQLSSSPWPLNSHNSFTISDHSVVRGHLSSAYPFLTWKCPNCNTLTNEIIVRVGYSPYATARTLCLTDPYNFLYMVPASCQHIVHSLANTRACITVSVSAPSESVARK